MIRFLWAVAAALMICGPVCGAALAQVPGSITIKIKNATPNFPLYPFAESFGASPRPFSTSGNNEYSLSLPIDSKNWYTYASIKIIWKSVLPGEGGIKSDMEQRIELRFNPKNDPVFELSTFYSNDRSNVEMTRLEGLNSIFDQYERLFRGIQVARFYRKSYGNTHPKARRAAKIAFEAAKKLAEESRHNVIMSDEAEQYILDAFGVDSDYKTTVSNIKSLYWSDLLLIDDFLKNNSCADARSLLAALRNKMGSELSLYQIQFLDNPNYFSKREEKLQAKCDASNNATN